MIDRFVLSSPLFAGISETAAQKMIGALHGRTVSAARGEILLRQGEITCETGVVLCGRILMETHGESGDRRILGVAEADGVFGNADPFGGTVPSSVTVTAGLPSRILFFDPRLIPEESANAVRFLRNFTALAARQNAALLVRLEQLSLRATRRKVLAYLNACAVKAGADTFEIPFDRQGLADYLFTDRSALSAELSRLRGEGALDFCKNRFTLKVFDTP